MSEFTLIVMAGVFIGSNVFWAFHCHMLINKLMSRNYSEFKEADLREPKSKRKMVENQESFISPRDLGGVDELFN